MRGALKHHRDPVISPHNHPVKDEAHCAWFTGGSGISESVRACRSQREGQGQGCTRAVPCRPAPLPPVHDLCDLKTATVPPGLWCSHLHNEGWDRWSSRRLLLHRVSESGPTDSGSFCSRAAGSAHADSSSCYSPQGPRQFSPRAECRPGPRSLVLMATDTISAETPGSCSLPPAPTNLPPCLEAGEWLLWGLSPPVVFPRGIPLLGPGSPPLAPSLSQA